MKMQVRFFVQFDVKRKPDGSVRSISARSLTKGPPTVRWDGVAVAFDVSIPSEAFRVPVVAVEIPLEHVGQPSADSQPFAVADEGVAP